MKVLGDKAKIPPPKAAVQTAADPVSISIDFAGSRGFAIKVSDLIFLDVWCFLVATHLVADYCRDFL
jgi:hypothetical protein